MKRGSGAAGPRAGMFRGEPLFWWAFAALLPRRPAAPLGLALLALMMKAGITYGQADRCVFQIDNVDRQGSVNETARGTNYFAGGNVRLSCRGQQLTMQSDSVAAYGGDVVQFIGNV